MRIKTLSERTGISKRNIHYYINEQLIQPKTHNGNGYFDFSEEDYRRLMLINQLRKSGFSIAQIKAMFQTPASSEYYIRMRLGRIEQEIRQAKHTSVRIQSVLEHLPANPDFSDLYSRIVEAEHPKEDEVKSPYDGMLVNHFLWRKYWNESELTEYQQFLWHKINKLTENRDNNPNYAKLYDYLCSQNHNKIDALYQERDQHFNYVAGISRENITMYAEEMKASVQTFIRTPAAVAQWKSHYHSFISPQVRIFTGPIGNLAEEMSSFFRAYKTNSSRACEIVYDWLNTEEGLELKREIQQVLQGYVDLECCNHAELESMNTIFEYG